MDSVGQWIQQTRKTKGFSLQQLADSLDPKISVQTLINCESGRVLPSRRLLVALAKALDVSHRVFTNSLVIGLHVLKYRKPPNVTARECERAEGAFNHLLERYFTIEQILRLDSPVTWREKLRPAKLDRWEDLEARADTLRSIWQLGMEPIPSMCELLEENGIKILESDVPERINGLACQAQVLNNGQRFIDAVLVSNRINVEQRRFTLAHELAYQVIPASGNPELSSNKAREWFTGAFLVPKQALLNAASSSGRSLSNSEIMVLKHKFGVPASCILMRLGHVGVLSSTDVEHAFQSYAGSWLDSEPDPIQRSDQFAMLEKPNRFERLVAQALAEQLISPKRAKSLLAMPRWRVK